MKKIVTVSLVVSLSALLAPSVWASPKHAKPFHHHHHMHGYSETYARVVRSTPIYREIAIRVPVDNCRVETTAYRERRGGDSFTGTVVGGLIGAAIGHEVGHSGHATAAGGLIGATIGNNVAGSGRQVTRYEDREVCTTGYRTEYQRELVGYDVTYRYDGRVYKTETRHHPGDRIVHVRRR